MSRKFFIAGVQHHNLRNVLHELEVGTKLDMVPEPDNKYDPNAVRLIFNETMCGYVPMRVSAEVSALIETTNCECSIIALNPNAKPWEMCEVIVQPSEQEENK